MRLTLNYHVNDRVLEGVFCYNYQHRSKYPAQGLKANDFCFWGPLSAWLHVWNKAQRILQKCWATSQITKSVIVTFFPQSSDCERHYELWNILVYAWAGQNIIKWYIYLIQINCNHKQLVSKRRSFSGSAPLFSVQMGRRKEYTQSPGSHHTIYQERWLTSTSAD